MRQIELDKTRGKTVTTFLEKYAPKHENDTSNYVKNLSKKLGVPEDTKLSDIPTINIAKIISQIESGTKIVTK